MTLSACAAPGAMGGANPSVSTIAQPATYQLSVAERARNLLRAQHYDEASALLNRTLKSDPTNADLHLLNGLAYHLRGLGGDPSLLKLAEVGYQTAMRIDPSKATAAYCNGLLALQRRDYPGAVNNLAKSLRYDGDNVEIMRAFVIAAYQAKRPDLAIAIARQLEALKGPDDDLLRVEALSEAALGRPEKATDYARRITSPASLGYVVHRIDQWKGAYQTASLENTVSDTPKRAAPGLIDLSQSDASPPAVPAQRIQLADISDALAQVKAQRAAAVASVTSGGSAAPTADATAAVVTPGGPEPAMAMVDLVIIQTEESEQTSVGDNLLNTLTAVVQGVVGNVRGAAGALGSLTGPGRVLGGVISVPQTTYSLNIANSSETRNEILARPTIVVVDKQASNFNAGETLTVSIPGSLSGGNLEDKSVGLTVTLTPTFLSPERLFMQVKAGRSFWTPVNVNANAFSQAVEISDVNMNGSAIVNLGETLVLSGLAERQVQASRNGTPILGEIPFVQLFFAQRADLEVTRTVMFLITPRPVVHFTGDLSLETSDSPEVKALKASEAQWFGIKDSPNYLATMHQFATNELYQEYRTGDVQLDVWNRQADTLDRLQAALLLLHY